MVNFLDTKFKITYKFYFAIGIFKILSILLIILGMFKYLLTFNEVRILIWL